MSRTVDIPVDPKQLQAIQSDEAKAKAIVDAALDFREFLNHWYFIDQEEKEVKILGHELWEGQEKFVQCMKDESWVFALKARKLGFTTLGCAFDAWVLRFRDKHARVHLFSRREKAAQELLKRVKYGLDRMPDYMRLPYKTTSASVIELFAGPDDIRHCEAYPADEETAVEDTCTHGHVDEWARMGNPESVWQAVEPSMAGTCHVITTGRGPDNYPAWMWRQAQSGDARLNAFFVGALNRRDRDEAWLEAKRKGMTEKQFRQEYAMTWEDALYGGGEFQFERSDLDRCCRGQGYTPAEVGHKYTVGWDIGRHRDAAVGVVIDLTAVPAQVVKYTRMRQSPYPVIQKAIEADRREYRQSPALFRLQVEKNSAGEAVIENLDIPELEADDAKFVTSKPSKARIISNLELGFENHLLEYNAREWPQLDVECRGYMIPDDNVIQDSVMALAIAWDEANASPGRGKVGRITSW